MTSLIHEADLLGYNVYQDSTNHYQWTIEISINKGKLLLQEQTLEKWILISNKIPQVWLETKEILEFLKRLKEK